MLAAASTQRESRSETFLRWNHYLDGAMPVPLRYCGADTTGRWSGTMKANMQNLPRIPRDKDGNIIPKRSNALRECLLARPGHKVIVAYGWHSDLNTVYSYVLHRKAGVTTLHVLQGRPCSGAERVAITIPFGGDYSNDAATSFLAAYPTATKANFAVVA